MLMLLMCIQCPRSTINQGVLSSGAVSEQRVKLLSTARELSQASYVELCHVGRKSAQFTLKSETCNQAIDNMVHVTHTVKCGSCTLGLNIFIYLFISCLHMNIEVQILH